MIKWLLCLIGLFTSYFIYGQEHNKKTYPPDYQDCQIAYGDLTRIIRQSEDYWDVYFLNEVPFSGCALKEHKAEQVFYLFKIQNGIVEQELGYHYNGKLVREFNFKKGKSHGVHLMNRTNGEKYIEEYYKNGQAHGYTRRWYAGNQLAREALFQHGILVSEKLFKKDGSPVDDLLKW